MLGLVLLARRRLPLPGRLPGDLRLEGKKWTFYFPLATCIMVSIVLTLPANLIVRVLFRR